MQHLIIERTGTILKSRLIAVTFVLLYCGIASIKALACNQLSMS